MASHQVHHPADRADHHLRTLPELRHLVADRGPPEHRHDLDGPARPVCPKRLGDLDAELACGRQDEGLHLGVVRLDVLEQGQAKGRGLAGPGLGLPDHVASLEQRRDRLLLDRRRALIAQMGERVEDRLGEAQLGEGVHAQWMLCGTAAHSLASAAMALTVVGSIAFDAVKTPFGKRERMLGGSAVHFALAASFFGEVRVVGPVGHDFSDDEYAVLHAHGINTDDVERVRGSTFFWRGHYEYDLNTAHTDETQLGVFGDFQPKLSDTSRAADTLFLANIQPDLQREVRRQCEGARLVGLDSMNLWIETARDALLDAIAHVDLVFMNDAEIRMLMDEPNLVRAARAIAALGPRAIVAKQGEYGAALFSEEGFFALPAYPLETVNDPTGAGDSFAGGFLGYLAGQGANALDDPNALRRGMVYGSTLASFCVEQFGTERVSELTREEIDERFNEFRAMTALDEVAA
jgi:sugar/nucleoside kinase (ribokinase family)